VRRDRQSAGTGTRLPLGCSFRPRHLRARRHRRIHRCDGEPVTAIVFFFLVGIAVGGYALNRWNKRRKRVEW
jgi:hypothetical protein